MNTKTLAVGVPAALAALLLANPALAADGTWASTNAGGDWNSARNWTGGIVPGGVGATASLTTETRDLKAVKLDTNVTLGRLDLNGVKAGGNGWKVVHAGGGGITLASPSGGTPPVINVANGSSWHVISAPLRGAQGYTKSGNGNLVVTTDNPYAGLTTVVDGKLTVNSPAGLGATGAGNGTIVEMGSGKYPQLHLAGDITTAEDIALRVRYYSPTDGNEIGANLLYSDKGWNTIGGMALDRAHASAVGNVMLFGVQVAKGSLTIAGPIRGLCSSNHEASGVFPDPNVLRFRLTTPDAKVFANAPISDGTIGTGGVSVQTSDDNEGTLVLLGANTHTGSTVHRKGVMLVNNVTGSGTGAGSVRVLSGATLGGSGTIAPAGENGVVIEAGGVLAPGGIADAAAVLADGKPLTIDLSATHGRVVFEANSTIAIDLGRDAGVCDRIAVTGVAGSKGRVVFKNTAVNFTRTGPIAKGLYTLVTFDDYDAYDAQLLIGSGLEGYEASLQYTGRAIQLLVEGGPGSN